MDEITVRMESTGSIETILAEDFDADIHERVEITAAKPDTVSDGFVTEDTLRSLLAEQRESNAKTIADGVAAALVEAGVGRTGDRPMTGSDEAKRGEDGFVRACMDAARVTPSWERLYTTLPDDEREVRSAESDVMIARHFSAVANKDWAAIREVADWDQGRMSWERAAMGVGSTAIGGALVPTPLSNLLNLKLAKVANIGPRATQHMSPNTSLNVAGENAVMVAAGTAENAAATENDPTWVEVTLTKKKSVAATRSSNELISDSPFSLVSNLSRQAANAFAIYNDAQDATDGDGTGTNQTDALENNASIATIDAAVASVTYADILAIFYGLLSQYRSGATWICNNALLQILAGLLDGNGRPIFVSAVDAGTALTGGQGAPGVGLLLQRPVIEAPMSSGLLMFGDLEIGYGVLANGEIRAESSTEAAFLADQTIFKFVQRRDGLVAVAEAFKQSKGITA